MKWNSAFHRAMLFLYIFYQNSSLTHAIALKNILFQVQILPIVQQLNIRAQLDYLVFVNARSNRWISLSSTIKNSTHPSKNSVSFLLFPMLSRALHNYYSENDNLTWRSRVSWQQYGFGYSSLAMSLEAEWSSARSFYSLSLELPTLLFGLFLGFFWPFLFDVKIQYFSCSFSRTLTRRPCHAHSLSSIRLAS